MYIKKFEEWASVKKQIDTEERKINTRAGEVRWCALGVNVGSEIDGKGDSFTRPVLVINISGSHLALVIPMSTQIKNIAGYLKMDFKGKTVSLCVHQTKVVSQKRLLRRIGKISDHNLEKHKEEIKKFFAL